MVEFIITLSITALSMYVASVVIPGMIMESAGAAFIGAFIFGLINSIIKPILVFFTFPITIVTLGLFLLVVNAICFSLVGYFTPGFKVGGFLNALFGSVIVSIVSTIINQIVF
ncbi:MAG: phage holin family protein [Cyanobacterium sp.]